MAASAALLRDGAASEQATAFVRTPVCRHPTKRASQEEALCFSLATALPWGFSNDLIGDGFPRDGT